MDAKALAKSKRAHSQHHSNKSHPNQKPKATSDGSHEAGGIKKSMGKPIKDRLPSNWDRYGEEIYPGSEELSNQAAPPVSDAILPKSKGADYRHLIAEAQSQMQSYTNMDVFPSLDDVLPRELISAGSAMVAARGENILSWIGDDSFIVDDKTTANSEASFLSLNLPTLAEQLEKIDLAKRLFIEEDMLPPELRAEGKSIYIQQSSEIQTIDYQEGTKNIEKSPITEFGEIGNMIDSVRDSKAALSDSFESIHQDPTFDSLPISSNPVEKFDPFELETSSRIKAPNYTNLEAELDMLLGSFSETTLGFDDSAAASNTSELDEVLKASPRFPSNGPDLAGSAAIAAELDDELDDLLQDTSNLISHKEKSVQSHIPSLSPHYETKTIAEDDFDSWLDTI